MSASHEGGGRTAAGAAKAPQSAARLHAVQALYQIALSGESTDHVLEEFLRHRIDANLDGVEAVRPKTELFTELVRGSSHRRDEIHDVIASALSQGWPLERLETILRCILEAGVYELLAGSVPARVVITEYVDVAHAFYSGAEPGMVNGILDRLARKLRPGEFEGDKSE